MRLLILAAAMLLSSHAYADIEFLPSRTFKVLIVCGHAVDCSRAEHTFELGSAYIKSVAPVGFQVIARVDAPEEMTGTADERYDKWRMRTEALAMSLGADITYVAVGPYPVMTDQIDPEAESVFGIALKGAVGILPGAMFMAKMAGSDKFNAKIVAHELAHLFGADHAESGLTGWSTSITQVSDSFAFETIQQIRSHLAMIP